VSSDALLTAVRAAGVPVVGLYAVGGSGYVAVLVDRPDDPAVAAIGSLHADLRARPGGRTEGVWAVREDLASPMGLGRRWWTVGPDDDRPRRDGSVNTAVRRWVLRERSTPLLGPPAAELVAVVTPEALAAEALGLARTRGEEIEGDPGLLTDPGARARVVDELAVAWCAGATAEVLDPGPSREWAARRLPDLVGVLSDPADAAPADVRRFVWEVHARLGSQVTAGGDAGSGLR